MTNDIRVLLQTIADGDSQRIKKVAEVVLRNNKTQKDKQFCETILRRITEKKDFIELPYNLKGMLSVEDVSTYPEDKFYWRENEKNICKKILSVYHAAELLDEKGIRYVPAAILYGESGCGKTELARYIAHEVGLPYAYVRFSALIDSHLGATQNNLSRIFEFIKNQPCVFCLDEIDAIGLARGQMQEVGEMARIVISLMQEMDSVSNKVIVIGTTNRMDMIDTALIRRFPMQYEIKKMNEEDGKTMARKFLEYAGIDEISIQEQVSKIVSGLPASTIIRDCTEFVIKCFSEVNRK